MYFIPQMVHKNSQKALQTVFKTSEKVEDICTDIYKSVEQTKMEVVKEFSPFIKPKKTLDLILEFYNVFIKAHEVILKSKENINEVFGDNFKIDNLQTIIENNLLSLVKNIKEEEDKLSVYKDVNIANDLLGQAKEFEESIVNQIIPVYFNNLYNENVSEEEMKNLSQFLMEFTDKKTFLSRYSNTILDKTSYDDVQLDKEKLLIRTEDINKHFKNINKYNEKILGYTDAHSINSGLNKLLIINLKKVIADILLVLEKDESLEGVPFCIKLNSHLRQGDEAEIKEVEELYVYKNEINKIVCNIFLAFEENIKSIENPNKFCDIETLVLNLKRALDALKENKNVTAVFIKNYGPFFKINNLEEFCEKMCTMTIQCVLDLSNQLQSLKKYIYLINNLFTLQNFITEVDGINIKDKINENTELIVKVWKEELASREGRRFSRFIENNCNSCRSYYLPDTVRNNIVPKIKAIIWENILTKGYQGDENALNENINEIFTGQ